MRRSTLYLGLGWQDSWISYKSGALHSFMFLLMAITSFFLFLGLILYGSIWPSSASLPYDITYTPSSSVYLLVASAFIYLICGIWVWRLYQLHAPHQCVTACNSCCLKFSRCAPKPCQCPKTRNLRP